MNKFAGDCGAKRHWSLAQLQKMPGAGMNQAAIDPYSTVLKDGYMFVSCIKDMLITSGDKFGNNKFSYTLEDIANVSIVRYSELVSKKDREPMTHDVCFKFCRTIPHMGFFGIIHGRDCYCTPYYKQVAGDSSQCTAVCEGSSSSFCGGMKKSSIFEMHMCSDTAMELSSAKDKASTSAQRAYRLGSELKDLAVGMQIEADIAQKAFGQVGDPVASDLMQVTKVWAGSLEHAAKDALESGKKLETLMGKAQAMSGADFTGSSQIALAEKLVADLEDGVSRTTKDIKKASKLHSLAIRGNGTTGRKAEYYPLMYFVDKSYVDVPSTCGGDWDKQTIQGSPAECAHACDMQKVEPECVGFSFYDGGLCFLFSKFTSVTYYPKCDSPKPSLPPTTAATTTTVATTTTTSVPEPPAPPAPPTMKTKQIKVKTPTPEPPPKPLQEPLPQPPQQPLQEPLPQPPQQPLQEPLADPSQQPLKEPLPDPSQPLQEPLADPSQQPLKEPLPDPSQPLQEPVAQPPPNLLQERFLQESGTISQLRWIIATSSGGTPTGTTQCFAKLENFEGTSLIPDPSGKCGLCLKEATKADRCFK